MIAASPVMLVLRFLHIVAGTLWVGSAFLFVGFIGPSAAEVGPSAGPLLSAAVKKRKVAKVITVLGFTTVIAGWLMWFRNLDSAGSLSNWLDSSYGIVLTIGGLLATGAFFTGYLGVGRNVERMVDLGDAIRDGGQPPTEQQMAEIGRLGELLEKHGKADLVLLLLAVTAMATARYW
jgi:small-conductance mechanosensitive channel